MTHALICIDFIAEIVGADGRLAAKGYRAFADTHKTMEMLADRQARTREAGGRVLHVHIGYLPGYEDHCAASPLLGGARAAGILQLGTASTELHPLVAPRGNDLILVKKRVSCFYGTGLELVLRSMKVSTVTLAGVATDIAVQSAAREAHDRDFAVEIAADCCAAASQEDHDHALANMAKFATIT